MSVRLQDGAALEADYAVHPPAPAGATPSNVMLILLASQARRYGHPTSNALKKARKSKTSSRPS
jgi:hypothetical protein